MNQRSVADQLNTVGFIVVRNVLSSDEVRQYRLNLLKRAGLQESTIDPKVTWLLADGPNKCPEWWPLITHDRILNLMREIIGPKIRYLRTSDLHLNNVRRIWHRDSPSRQFGIGSDFDESQEKYHVYRVGIYLQSYQESGSALGLLPGTHHREPSFMRAELRFWDRIRWLLRKDYLIAPLFGVRPVWIKTEPGDAIIFDARVFHAPSSIHGPKLAVFLSYGADNKHSRNFQKHYVQDRKSLNYAPLHPELKQILARRGLLMDDDTTDVNTSSYVAQDSTAL